MEGQTPHFRTGVKIGLMIYFVGTVLTAIVHLIFGWDNAHAPPTAFLAVLFTLGVGAIRLILTLVDFLANRSPKSKGELLVHVAIGVLLLVFILVISRM